MQQLLILIWDITILSCHTAPAQTRNRALFVGCSTHNLKPKTSFYSRVIKKLQMSVAGFNFGVAHKFYGSKPTIWLDCGLRLWSVCRPLWVSLTGCSCLLMGFQLRVLDCSLWVSVAGSCARAMDCCRMQWKKL